MRGKPRPPSRAIKVQVGQKSENKYGERHPLHGKMEHALTMISVCITGFNVLGIGPTLEQRREIDL
jgi:hypothetical protein